MIKIVSRKLNHAIKLCHRIDNHMIIPASSFHCHLLTSNASFNYGNEREVKATITLLVNFDHNPNWQLRFFCNSDELNYDRAADETLELLSQKLEEVLERHIDDLPDCDVNLSSGVLTLHLAKHGIYVVNKQSPNRQIWLSSPISGPKRYDFIDGNWIYKHDGKSLHELLSHELSSILKDDVQLKM